MIQKQFKELMESSRLTGKENISSLQEMTREYPYFQTAHVLLAKAYHDQEHVRYDRQLKLAAAYSGDRRILFELIHRPETASPKFFREQDEISSPFILEEKSSEETPGTIARAEEETSEQVTNPFLDAPEISSGEDSGKSESGIPHSSASDIPSLSEIHTFASSEETFISSFREEAEPEPESHFMDEQKIEDPREVIKKRLSEIFGETPVEQPKEDKKPETPFVPAESILPLAVTGQKSEEHEIAEKLLFSGEADQKEKLIQVSQPQEIKEDPVEEATEIIRKEIQKPLGVMEKTELEHALEETLLHSLEKLPVLEKEISKTPLPAIEPSPAEEKWESKESPRSFSAWLKARKTVNFGFVEEVHADAETFTGETRNLIPEEQVQKTSIRDTGANVPGLENETESVEVRPVDSKSVLIDRFIATEPRIVPSKAEFYSPASQAKKSLTEHEDLVSETLAKIYLQQGNYQKARWSYQKLSLLHPEKSSYFAALVKEIDEQFNNLNKEDL